MSATELISKAFSIGLHAHEEFHKKWISVSYELERVAGAIHAISLQRIGRLDMLLRVLEGERLEFIKAGLSSEPDLSLDLQIALSENWLFSAYEVSRAAKKPLQDSDEDPSKLLKLEHRLSLVRMPLAKGEIQGMNKRENRDNPPMLIKARDEQLECYQNDGSYIMPHGICGATGAALWRPIDITKHETITICRRDLSDEMLTLFD